MRETYGGMWMWGFEDRKSEGGWICRERETCMGWLTMEVMTAAGCVCMFVVCRSGRASSPALGVHTCLTRRR